jgi:hypothetical protein
LPWSAFHTVCGVAGIGTSFTLRALPIHALCTTANLRLELAISIQTERSAAGIDYRGGVLDSALVINLIPKSQPLAPPSRRFRIALIALAK